MTPFITTSRPDSRDFLAKIERTGVLPTAVDLMPDVFEVEDQGDLGSCTANAGCSALELMYKRAGKPQDFSRMFLYYVERHNLEGRTGDTGAEPRNIGKALNQFGVCLESSWPYDREKLDTEPPSEIYAEAERFKIAKYESLARVQLDNYEDVVANLKHCLAQGIPVLLTISVYKSFFSLSGDWRKHSFSIKSAEDNPMVGLHEVLIIGYDDQAGRFLVQNSWGPTWGDGGFFGFPYEYILGAFLMEVWALTDPGVPVTPVPGYLPIPQPIPQPQPEPTPQPDPVVPTPEPLREESDGSNAGLIIGAICVAILLAVAIL